MNKSVVIIGEASETESEDESIYEKSPANNMTISIQGAVVTGEDSESENENDASISSAVSALNQLETADIENRNTEKYDSLLQQKLRENNSRLLQGIDSFCSNTIDGANRSLNSIDQHLIRSQLTLQSAVTSLKSISANSAALKNKLQSLLSAKFIPNINVTNK